MSKATVWMPEDAKCTISRNVTFHEDKVFKDTVVRSPKESKQTKKGKRFSFSFDRTFEGSGSGGVLSETTNVSSSSESKGSDSSESESVGQEEAETTQEGTTQAESS